MSKSGVVPRPRRASDQMVGNHLGSCMRNRSIKVARKMFNLLAYSASAMGTYCLVCSKCVYLSKFLSLKTLGVSVKDRTPLCFALWPEYYLFAGANFGCGSVDVLRKILARIFVFDLRPKAASPSSQDFLSSSWAARWCFFSTYQLALLSYGSRARPRHFRAFCGELSAGEDFCKWRSNAFSISIYSFILYLSTYANGTWSKKSPKRFWLELLSRESSHWNSWRGILWPFLHWTS